MASVVIKTHNGNVSIIRDLSSAEAEEIAKKMIDPPRGWKFQSFAGGKGRPLYNDEDIVKTEVIYSENKEGNAI